MPAEHHLILPSTLAPIWQRYEAEIAAAQQGPCAALQHKVEYTDTVEAVCVKSDFIANIHARDPGLVAQLFTAGEMLDCQYLTRYPAILQQELTDVSDCEQLGQVLRQQRRKAFLRIAWRDLAGWSDLALTIADLSAFADAVLVQALATIKRLEQLPDADFVVIAMGKLGAHELNFSSDIDLIFACDEHTISAELAAFVAQRLIDVLHTSTESGFVFRVDMRLRPFGDSGALVSTLDGLLQYYNQHGRDWERYAWIKARCVTGLSETRAHIMSGMMSFVYRPYVDFSMQSAIRDMKHLVEIEVRKKSMQNHIKLGSGGIREIEFVVQALQLIHGGRYLALQTNSIYSAMRLLVKHQLLSVEASAELLQAYEFLRQVEHKLQIEQDEQTHDLPKTVQGQVRLAYALGYAEWSAFFADLQDIRETVVQHFSTILAMPEEPVKRNTVQSNSTMRRRLLRRHRLRTEGHAKTAVTAVADVTATGLLDKLRKKGLKTVAMGRVEKLLPILHVAAEQSGVVFEEAQQNALLLLETIAFRSTYVSLLSEHAAAVPHVLGLMSRSRWIKQLLLRYPMLLVDVVRAHEVEARLPEDIEDTLHRFVHGIDETDTERQMEAVRHFKLSMLLSVAMYELNIQGDLSAPAAKLSEVAESIIAYIEKIAWQALTRMHGFPEGLSGHNHGFLVVGYGKLGGGELSYSSDLDLVFLYHSISHHTLGERRLGIHSFYAKLAQKVVHLLRTQTYSGALYEVDLRLRPSGNSGLLVSSLEAFSQYQCDSAWTWEHQALVRARPVAGDASLQREFYTIRADVLARKRDEAVLRQEICDMQARLRTWYQRADNMHNRIRYMPGGMIDLEFLAQYWLLAHAHTHADLLDQHGTEGILRVCAELGVVAPEQAQTLRKIYQQYTHALRMDWLLSDVSEDLPVEFVESVAYVLSAWQAFLY